MNKRINKILNELIWNGNLNVGELSERFNIRERSIRFDIKSLNDELKLNNLPVVNENAEGTLSIDRRIDIKEVEEFVSKCDFYSYTMTLNERHTVIAMILLNAQDYITVDKVAELIGVSRNTVLHDLQDLKSWFSDAGMNLTVKQRRGYIVEAPETIIRKNIVKLLEVNCDDMYYQNGYNLSIFWNLLINTVDSIDIYFELKDLLVKEEDNVQMYFADYSFFEALLELVVTVNRISHNRLIDMSEVTDSKELENSSKKPISESILKKIGNAYNITISDAEILIYTKCLRSKRYIKDGKHSSSTLDIRIMIAETIHEISSDFGIDFYLDFDLYNLLEAHMRSAVHRVKNGEILVNPLKDSIKSDYPDILEIVKKRMVSLEEYVGKEFSEDELLFLVLYFASVLEKEKVENEKNYKVPVALVCATGRGTAQFMMAKLKMLDDLIEIVSVSSYHNMTEVRQSGAQMIISTFPLPNAELPYVVVRSPMLSKEDFADIQEKVAEIKGHNDEEPPEEPKEEPLKLELQGAFRELLIEERIMLDYEAKDWEDAIRAAGKLLYETGMVEEQYVEEMVNNVKELGPYIVACKGMALPHADTDKGVIEEAATIVRLKNPIDFHSGYNDPVKYVVGISIKDAKSINHAIYDMMMIFGNEKVTEAMDQVQTPKEMIEFIDGMENQIN